MMATLTRTQLAELNVFSTICRKKSFRLAAAELGVSTSALSHTIRSLEERIGVKLLNRTNRAVVPTPAGMALAGQLEQGFDYIKAAVSELQQYRDEPIGHLRLNIPRDALDLLIAPVMESFAKRYPKIALEVAVNNHQVDIIHEGFDAGIRYGEIVPKDMIAVPLTGKLRWVLAAAPEYLAREGCPASPDELKTHSCINMRLGNDAIYQWELGDGENHCRLAAPGQYIFSETSMIIKAALAGLGLAYCLEMQIEEHLRSGELQCVMPNWAHISDPFMMYYPSRHQLQPGLRPLIALIKAQHLRS
ncbi:D-malate degradation protein R [Serratia entomophila]|jgi:DNA-binding transcriptional LysR family regulator|nr:LysR family transcriptional regulator [Serratia entomophila]CAI0713391.1 D-malate degradation protein R [Serratia entomophila]CAI0715182.1 D-malate degradation protein R [Serratia entomophila]CAI0717100.1 D-malate degradation protein R [Serratia entomophila]CAI0717192.1 D-malate degradation protein R [Serratia entomophila]CAI0722513.1 D-malate degradation protein R [Serratia entomophila]